MGNRFILEPENNCEDFCKSESEILRGRACFWEPTIEIRLVDDNQIIIEPMDQRRNSRYHSYIKELLGRASERFDYFSFKREGGFYPNPQLHPLFFRRVILGGALERARNREQYTFAPSSKILSEMEQTPLSDDFLKDMLNNGLCINYSEQLKAGTGCCYPSCNGLVAIVSKLGSQKDVDETLVHEVVEAYVMRIYGPSVKVIPHDYVSMLVEELYEFGFAQTIRRLIPDSPSMKVR